MEKFYLLYGDRMVDLLIIGLIFLLGKIFLRLLVNRLVRLTEKTGLKENSHFKQRKETLERLVIDNGSLAIDAVILIMILGLFGVDLRPILAGLGIVGLALGFGAQSLVKDFVSGLFILIENQYNVGDTVQIGSNTGIVDRITLRSTVLKDNDGKTYYIANGTINSAINLTQNKSNQKN